MRKMHIAERSALQLEFESVCPNHVLGIYFTFSDRLSRKCCNWHVSWALSEGWQLGNNAAVLPRRMTMHTIPVAEFAFRLETVARRCNCFVLIHRRRMIDEDKCGFIPLRGSRSIYKKIHLINAEASMSSVLIESNKEEKKPNNAQEQQMPGDLYIRILYFDLSYVGIMSFLM